jgi:hypothetical protein
MTAGVALAQEFTKARHVAPQMQPAAGAFGQDAAGFNPDACAGPP